MKRLIGKLPLLGFGLAGGLFLTAAILARYSGQGLEQAAQTLSRSQAANDAFHALRESLWAAQSSFRGFLLTRNPALIEDYPIYVASGRAALERLKAAEDLNPGLAGRLPSLEAQAIACLGFDNRAIALAQAGQLKAAAALVETGEGKRLMAGLEAQLKPLAELQESLTLERQRALQDASARASWILGLGLLSALIAVAASSALALAGGEKLRRTEQELRAAEERGFKFLDALPVGVFVMEPGGNPFFENKAGEQILGRGAFNQVQVQELSKVYGITRSKTGEPYPPEQLPIVRALQGEACEATDMEVRRPDGKAVPLHVWGTPVFDASAHVRYAIAAFADMTENEALLHKLEELSRYDPVTGLYNRRAFTEQAELQLKQAQREQVPRLLFFADMDNLKWINDTLGHTEGDKAIHDMARVLRVSFRDTDLIGRLGGDEFAVLAFQGPADKPQLFSQLFRERLESLNHSVGRKYRLDFSFGQVLFDPQHPRSLSDMIAEADELMYAQKRAKKAQAALPKAA
jgi:diguanylate cyclase (GGDEF)-like protein